MGYAEIRTEQQPLKPDDAGFITNLIGLSAFLDNHACIELGLNELTEMVSALLGCENCSIMLLKEDIETGEARLRVYAHHGYLPEEAYQESMSLNQGIAGKVAATGEPLLITAIEKSSYAGLSRRHTARGGFISVPIAIGDKVIGVLNSSRPRNGRALEQEDLKLATMVALMVAKSIQVSQLQHLLHSNFIQFSLAQEVSDTPQHSVNEIVRNGMKMSKILGKTFFREMREAGFSDDHILSAATEVIHLLGSDMKERHVTTLPKE